MDRSVEKSEIFQFMDYREFLSYFYEDQKARKTGFTYARFAKKAGLGSPNYYKLVMDGEKNLTPENVVRFAGGMDLSESETDFFETLVNYNQAKVELEKKFYFERLERIKKFRERQRDTILSKDQFESISHWVFHAVYVLSKTPSWDEDSARIKTQLFDLASIEDINHAKATLKNANLLNEKKQEVVRAKPEQSGFSATTFYQSLLSRARKMFEVTPPEETHLNSYMVGLSKEKLPELKTRVREFMRELTDWALESENQGSVYAFTFMGFPVSKEIGLKESK